MAWVWLVFPYAGVPTKPLCTQNVRLRFLVYQDTRHLSLQHGFGGLRLDGEKFSAAANSLLNLFSLRPNTLTSAFHSLEMATQVLSVLQTGKTCSAESMPFPRPSESSRYSKTIQGFTGKTTVYTVIGLT